MVNFSLNFLIKRYPIVVALFTQVVSLFILRNFLWKVELRLAPWSFVLLQGFFCASIYYFIFKLPRWFLVIAFLFPTAFMIVFSYSFFSHTFWGVGFILLALTFSHTLKDRVPLYLSNKTTHAALKKISEERNVKKVLDLGSGLGGVVRSLASDNTESIGVESAPSLWVISSLLSKLTGQGKIIRQNIWDTPFDKYEMVYAFLSPAVMEKVHEKIKKEMKPGTLFISNSFAVPDCQYDALWVLDDARKTQLFLYEIK